jgi:hypothetical protein
MGRVSPVLYQLVVLARLAKNHVGVQISGGRANFTISCENSKILFRLLSVLSLPRKFVYDHCCCPNSAIMLTVFKVEAILDFGRGCQNLSIILWGGERRGGRKWRVGRLLLLSHLKGGVRGGGGGEREE